MLHQPGHRPPQLRAIILTDDILNRLAELKGPVPRRRLHRKVVAVPDHGRPLVAVQIVDSAPGADQEIFLLAERAQRFADAHMVVGVEAGVHADDCGRGAATGKHPDEDQVGVVDPVEFGVGAGVEAGGLEHGDTAAGGGEVGVKGVVGVFGWVDVGDGGFGGVGVRGDFDHVAEAVPVGTLVTGEVSGGVEVVA